MKNPSFAVKQYGKMAVQRGILPVVYNRYRRRPIDEKLVVFADSHNDTLPFHMMLMRQEMARRGYRISECTANFGKLGVSDLMREMTRFMELYAQAKYVILCDYYLPAASCDKRPETKVLQLWHAGGCLKKFGCDAAEDIPPMYRGSVTKNFDLVTVSAPKCVPAFASALGLPEQRVEPLGISRTDSFFDDTFCQDCRESFYRRYPHLQGKKLILWAPTFRGNAGNPTIVGREAVEHLQKQLGEDYHVLIKLHPHADGKAGVSNCEISTHRLLPVIDLLITDFSSILFDYSLFNKPAVLYAPDYDEYVRGRGFYMNFETDLPYPIVKSERNLCNAVRQALFYPDTEGLERFRQTFMGSCDGQATKRIADRIESL